MIGVPGWRPRATGSLVPAWQPPDDATLRAGAGRRPSVVAARAGEDAAQDDAAVAERAWWPMPDVTLGAFTTSDPGGTGMVVGLSIPLPLFDRGQGPRARAAAAARRARLQREAVSRAADVELDRALALYRERRAALDAYERDVISRLPKLRQMAEDAYRGQGSIVDLVDALRSIREAELEHVDLQEQTLVAETDARAAAGLIDTDGPGPGPTRP
jgi:cobalt-zinc-cadmium efflux system outer membrane protein